jgi:hypothetical protein
MEERDYETEARKDGWVPLDEWKGDPEQHKSAEQFVEDGEKITGILKSKLTRTEQKVEDLGKRVDELLATNKQFGEFTKKAQEREKKEKESLISELEGLRKKAVDEGDGEAFTNADRQLTELRAEPEPQEPISPAGMQWLEDNDWYQKDDAMSAYADRISDRLREQGYVDQSEAFFNELTTRVKDRFSDEFENKNRSRPNGVESGHEAGTSKSKTWDSLPAGAKREFESFARDIPGYTKQQYLADYEWEQDDA